MVAVPRILILKSLNRTFYGIETRAGVERVPRSVVLIVPFMELKRRSTSTTIS